MVDEQLLSRKLSQLRQYVSELRKAKDITWSIFNSDIRAKAFVERYIHLAIEKMIDIGNHLISFNKWREPQGYRDIFQVLNENGIIPENRLKEFQNMASFRNILVHEYEKIEDELVFVAFKKRLGDFEEFIELVKGWVEKNSSKEE